MSFLCYAGIRKIPVVEIAETTLTYTTPGIYTFVVPANVIRLRVRVYGAGGGGGASEGGGDQHAGGGGGAGGYKTFVFSVTPGETITLVVGAGGKRGYWRFNSTWYLANDSTTSGSPIGGDGDITKVSQNSIVVAEATGGKGGGAAYGDSANGAGGEGGYPDGVAGQTSGYGRNSYPATPGGDNGTGYGKGGDGSGTVPFALPTNGGNGAIVLTYGGILQAANDQSFIVV